MRTGTGAVTSAPRRFGLPAKAVGKLVRTVRRVQADDEGRKR